MKRASRKLACTRLRRCGLSARSQKWVRARRRDAESCYSAPLHFERLLGTFSTTERSGNDVTGSFSLSDSTQSSSTTWETDVNQTDAVVRFDVGTDSSASTDSGNNITGSFSSGDTDNTTDSSSGTETNQTLTATTSATNIGQDTSQQSGNNIIGSFSLFDSDTSSTTSWETDVNQTDTTNSLDIATSSATSGESGNNITGASSTSETDNTTDSASATETNQTLTATTSSTTLASDSTQRSGNDITGSYTLSDSSQSSSTHWETDVNQTDTKRSTTSEADSSSDTETGNDVTGAYARGENSPTSGTIVSTDFNQSQTTSISQNDSGTTSANSTGNRVTGDTSGTSYDTDTTSVFPAETNMGDLVGPPALVVNASETDVSTDSTTFSANDITGQSFTSAHEVEALSRPEGIVEASSNNSGSKYSLTTTDSTETANTVTGSFNLTQNTSVSFSNYDANSDAGLASGQTELGVSSDTLNRSGDNITGGYSFSEIDNSSSTLSETDQAGGVTSNATTFARDYSSVSAAGNDVTGAAATSQFETSSGTLEKTDSYSRPIPLAPDTDAQTISSNDTTSSYQSGNDITGGFSLSGTSSDSVVMNESGTREGDGFSASSNDTSSTSSQRTGNSITGAEQSSQTTTDSTVSGDNGVTSAGSYTMLQTDNSTATVTGGDNAIVGSTTTTTTSSDTTTSTESSWLAMSSMSFQASENTAATHSANEAGNTVTGAYSSTDHETDSTSLTQSGLNSNGVYSLTATTSESPVITEFGDSISGGYTLSETSTQDYSFSELNSTGGGYMGGGGGGSSFSLSETGVKTYAVGQSGSHATGDYSLHEIGGDDYTIRETGGTSTPGGGGGGGGSMSMSGSYSSSSSSSSTWGLTLSGVDNYTIDESGDELSGEFTRTTRGGGGANLSESGSIAQNPYNSTPATAYTVSEAGNYLSGQISLGETGSDRYALINSFNNVSNALPSAGNGPGDIEYSPVGAPFQMGGTVFSGVGALGDINAAASDAAFDELGMQLLHEYCWRGTTYVFVADNNERPSRAVPKLISEVRPGDKVLCPSDKDPHGPAAWKEVRRTFKNKPAALLALTTDRGNVVYPTANHPIYVVERGWTPAGELHPGDPLLSRDGTPLRVASVTETGLVEQVYNLFVEGHHTYFVSDGDESCSLLAHNASPEKQPENTVPRLRIVAPIDLTGQSEEGTVSRQLSAAGTIPLQLAMPDGSVRNLGQMDPRVYNQLQNPPIVADAHHQLEAAKLRIATPADLVTEEIAGVLGNPSLVAGAPIFAGLKEGQSAASRYGSYFDAPVTMYATASRQLVLQNGGLGYRLVGTAPSIMDPGIAAEAVVFGPASVRTWKDRMSAIDIVMSTAPYVSDSRDTYEVLKGKDMVTEEKLHWWGQRGITAAAMFVPFVAGAWFRKAKAGTGDLLADAFNELADFRRELGPIPSRHDADGGTLARLDIAGQQIYGINAHGQEISINAGHFNKGHAEIDTLQQAFNRGIRAEQAVMFVDRELCKYCRRVDGLGAAMRDLGISELIIHDPSASWRVRPGERAVEIPRP